MLITKCAIHFQSYFNEDVLGYTILIGFIVVSIVDARVNDHNYNSESR